MRNIWIKKNLHGYQLTSFYGGKYQGPESSSDNPRMFTLYKVFSLITNPDPSPCQFILGVGNTEKVMIKSRWKETFSNKQRVIMHDRRTKLNHFIYCTENQYEVSIQRMSSMLRTRGFTAWRIKGLGPQAWRCQYLCEYQMP